MDIIRGSKAAGAMIANVYGLWAGKSASRQSQRQKTEGIELSRQAIVQIQRE
jgi:hypothetical protein